MKTSFKKLPGSVIELEVDLDQKEFGGYWQAAYDHALANVQLKGFRPGTAPKELADQAVDKDEVFEEAANSAVRFSLDNAVQENDWTIIDTPKIELQESPTGLRYKATLAIFPEIKLVDYKKIAKKVFAERKDQQVSEKELEDAIKWLRESRAAVVRVAREAKIDDVVEIDLESSVDGAKLDNFKGDKFVLGRSFFVPGFDQQLVGKKEGENLEFSLTAPEDFRQEKVRGKKVDFKVKLNGVFERQLPELTDEFVKGLGSPSLRQDGASVERSKFENVETFKKQITENIKEEKDLKESERLRLKILDEVIAASKIDIPAIMIEKTLDQMMAQFPPSMDEQKRKEFREKLRPKAERNVAANLTLYKIAQEEKIEYDEKEGLDNSKVFIYLENLVNK